MSGTNPDEIPITEIRKNSREVLRFTLQTFKGHRLLSARVFATKPDGTEIPTRSGLSVRIEMLADIQKALQLAASAAEDAGWLSSEKEAA